jgi:polysaccharide export outer membrane protein
MSALAVFLLQAISSAPNATAPSAPGPSTNPAPPPVTAGIAGAADADYRIGPGDILRIAVYGHEDLTQTVIVQPGGTFIFPLLGAIPAADATPAELEERIAARLAKGLIRDAKVMVAVQEYRSKVVYVVGEVARPGTYPLAGQATVVEMLSRAGPVSPQAGQEVLILRAGAPGGAAPTAQGEVLRVDMREIQAGHLDKNLVLRAGDTVMVPQAERIFVSGEVRNPGAIPFSDGLTIRQAVSLAGGFTPDASTGKARVVRQVNGRTLTLKLKVDEPVLSGDTVVVQTRLF